MTTTTSAQPTISTSPVTVPAPGRGDDLQVRVSAPAHGTDLPVVVLAHGFGESMTSYAPLVDHWAAHGLVVVQPTFLDSATLRLDADDPRQPDVWRIRVDDLVRTLDHLEQVLAALPGLAERVDRGRIAVAGHSWGGQSVSMLLGARVLDDDGVPGPSRRDERIRAGVLLSTPGHGDVLTPFAREHFPFMRPDFSGLTTPTLVIAGAQDQSPLSTRGPDWFADAYHHSPGAESLVTIDGVEHSLGGIEGHATTDAANADAAAVDLVARASLAYLLATLGAAPGSGRAAVTDIVTSGPPLAQLTSSPLPRTLAQGPTEGTSGHDGGDR